MLSQFSESAESAVFRINRMYAQLKSASQTNAIDSDEPILALMYPYAISLVEDFSTSWLTKLVSEQLATDSIGDKLWQRHSRSTTESWHERDRAWSDLIEVDHKTFEDIADFELHVEVRNALAHGAGALTSRQLKDTQLPTKLREINVHLTTNGTLQIGEDAVRHLVRTSIAYIAWIDQQATGSGPE